MTGIERIGSGFPAARAIAGCTAVAAIVALLFAGCGGKGSHQESNQTGRPDTASNATAGKAGAPESPAPVKGYGYDRAAEYVRDLQERVAKVTKGLDDTERLIRATEAPQTAEMDARLETLRSIAEDITNRGVDAENSATERDWPVWQASLEKEMANLVHAAARLDSLVAAVRRSR